MGLIRFTLCVAVVGGTSLASGIAGAQADFEGIWSPHPPANMGQPLDGDFNYTAAGQAQWERFGADNDPSFRCQMPGVPRGIIDPYPLEIIQQDHQVVFLYEYYHQVRRIYLDGREAPEYWPLSLAGYSTGHWEGDTLVVRTTHLSPDNVMTTTGRPFSGAENTFVIERYTLADDVITLVAEIHDPTYYEDTYVMRGLWNLAPDGEIWEYDCDPGYGDVG